MNERIRELMKEANKDITLGKPFWPALEEFSEKFAELIVRECSNIVFEEGCTEDNQDCPNEELYQLSNKIEQHFGVEL